MPFTQKAAWLKVQKNYRTHQQLAHLVENLQSPEKKKTVGDFTNLKRLHNLYKKGQLKKNSEGLFVFTHVDHNYGTYNAISVPTQMFPGLVQALHLKLNHPSKMQLQKLLARHFYSPSSSRIIEEITANCVTCTSLKQLPEQS